MERKIKLNEKNNISDSPNNFLNIIYNLKQKYKLNLNYFIVGIGAYNDSHDDVENDKGNFSNGRDFKAQLIGDGYNHEVSQIEIHYDYEENTFFYIINGQNEVKVKEIDKYLRNASSKVNYYKGEIVRDFYGNEYTVLEDSKVDEKSNIGNKAQHIKVMNNATKEEESTSYHFVSFI